jgi:hypothetical protein
VIILPPKWRLKKYGLTAEQYIELWDLCGGRCPICSKKFNNRITNRQPCIDHDHKTYKVRGLLCRACNIELGYLHDNEPWLDAAARYLRFPPALQLWTDVPYIDGAPNREND